jgi:hypothetical protein
MSILSLWEGLLGISPLEPRVLELSVPCSQPFVAHQTVHSGELGTIFGSSVVPHCLTQLSCYLARLWLVVLVYLVDYCTALGFVFPLEPLFYY